MKAALVVLPLVAMAQPAHSHCYSVWHYNVPQHCGRSYIRVAQEHVPDPDPRDVSTPPARTDGVDIPLPSLTDMTWDTSLDTSGQLELLRDIGRVAALRKLEEEMR